MLADLKIAGKPRRVVMQASKNGYFYVLDAKSGQFISAKNFVTANWALGFDPKTGRPNVNPEVRYDETGKAAMVQPGGQGAHGWHPMSFNPKTGLVYFSGVETAFAVKSAPTFKAQPMAANTGLGGAIGPDELKTPVPKEVKSQLVAWDPVNQKEVWRSGVNGNIGAGTLTTAGGLVFQGRTTGRFVAYRATDGKELWSMDAQTGVVAGSVELRNRWRAVHCPAGGIRVGALWREQSVAVVGVQAEWQGVSASGASTGAAASVESACSDCVSRCHQAGAGEIPRQLRDVP